MTERGIPPAFGRTPRGRLLVGVASVAGIRTLLPALGIDQLTTTDAWSKPICLLFGGIVALTVVTLSVFAWVRTPPKDRPSAWPLRAGVNTLFLGAVAAWACVGFLGVEAQYLAGAKSVVVASVIAVEPRWSSIFTCEEFVTMRRDNDQSQLNFCLKTRRGPALTAAGLEPGKIVRLHVAETALGNVVRSIDPAT